MAASPPNALYAFVAAFVDELARSGLRRVCICPGSRSTPLALSIAQHPEFKIWMHLDERSAAFFGLGLAKASREPVALLCTSGTAAANFMPAMIEAKLSNVPLVALTADRPPELREVGAPQTIDQIRLYGSHVKWSVEMATPGMSDDLLRYARATACRAVATALAVPRGPVHLNFPFREPLVPAPAPDEISASVSAIALHGRPDGEPYVAVPASLPLATAPQTQIDIARHMLQAPEGLIVCGPLDDPDFAAEVVALAGLAGYPILADPLSGLRCIPSRQSAADTSANGSDGVVVVDAYDAILRGEEAVESLAPRLVLCFGAIPTSKPLLQYMQRHAARRRIVVAAGAWPDPNLIATQMVSAEPAAFCRDLAALLARIEPARLDANSATQEREHPARSHADMGAQDREHLARIGSRWRQRWHTANQRAREALAREMAAMDELFEGRVFAELADLLPANATLWAGSSMPVRDLDTFFPARHHPIRFLANRGANGIDGVVSSALGAAAGVGPTVLAIGDISFYHDMNGLLAAARYGLDLTIVLINNDGGGIFSFLPQAIALSPGIDAAGPASQFELLFGTPHGLDFSHAAAMYGATFTRVSEWSGFRAAMRAGMAGGLHIVEVPTNRDSNVTLHRRCWLAVASALAGEPAHE